MFLGPLHTQDWGPMTITLQALSFVQKVELVQVHFTLRLWDQWSKWMQDGFLHGIKWIVFYGHLDYFQKPPPGGRPNTKTGRLCHSKSHNQCFIMFLSCVKTLHEYKFIEIAFGWGSNHIWLHTTLEGPWPHYIILEVSWDGLYTLLLGSHNFMVTALGSCVKWPLGFLYPNEKVSSNDEVVTVRL